MATTWTNEKKLPNQPSITYNENDTAYEFFIESTYGLLIEGVYKLLIGDGLPSYNDVRYNYSGQLIPQWDTDDRNITSWSGESKNSTSWANESKV